MGAYRWAYNKTVEYCEKGYQIGVKNSFSYMSQRKSWKEYMLIEAPWVEEIPAHTIYGAMMDASKDYKMHVKKLSKGQTSSRPRCKKRFQKSFYLLGNRITEKGFYTRKLGVMRSYEKLPNKPKDSRIMKISGKWYLKTPYEKTTKHRESKGGVVALDPGVRTFLTYFSGNEVGKIGDGQFTRLMTLVLHADDLKSRMSKVKAAKRYSMRKAYIRMLERIKNLVKDLHYQSAHYLCNNFDTIIIPECNFSSAVKKRKRKIRSKTVRNLLSFSFAKFRDRLKSVAEVLGVQVVVVNEAYTSKTHAITGEIKNNLGGSKWITSQNLRIDRDINGSLGIFLKGLLAQPTNS